MTVHDLPAVNATLNGLSAVFLALGFFFIKRGNKIAHRNCMVAALTSSTVFLACYLTYHFYAGRTVFPANWFKPIYLLILLTHTILAVVIVPMIIVTLAFRSEKVVASRKKLVRVISIFAATLFLIGLAITLLFGAPRTASPHLNFADVISGALIALSLILGGISLLLFLFEAHKKVARWTWPLWMYVSVTGVVIYWLLYIKFPQK